MMKMADNTRQLQPATAYAQPYIQQDASKILFRCIPVLMTAAID